jgi:hypothetical protein
MNKTIKGFLFFFVLFFLSGCGADSGDIQHIEKSQKYLQQGQWKAALIELKNALR